MTRFSASASAKPAAASGSFTSCKVVNSHAGRCGATCNLQDDGKGGELACAVHVMVLCDLRELGDKGVRDSPKLRYSKRAGRHSERCKSDCKGGKDSRESLPVGLGAAVRGQEEECSVGGDSRQRSGL